MARVEGEWQGVDLESQFGINKTSDFHFGSGNTIDTGNVTELDHSKKIC